MGVFAGPDIVDSGLVLALDAADRNSFDSNENLLAYSKDFSAGWSSSLTVTLNNATAPDETFTAAKIQRPINSGNSAILNHPTLSTNTNYCYSAFIKLASTPDSTYSVCSLSSISDSISPAYASISYNFVTGTISSFGNLPTISGVIPYPNGWYRLYMVINTSSQTNAFLEIRPLSTNLVSDFYIWGAQLERGSSPSPYYPTTATTKTRGSTLIDLTGRGNTGTLTNSPTYNSSNGGSIVFDGTNDVVNSTTSIIDRADGQEITVSCWIKPSRTSGQYSVFCTNRSDNTAIYNWIFYQHTTDGAIAFHGDAQNKSSYVPTINVWINVTNTVTASGVSTLYVNGVSTYTVTGYTYGNGTPSRLGIGADPGGQEPFQGNISQVQIYNRALSATEIQQNFNATRKRFGI